MTSVGVFPYGVIAAAGGGAFGIKLTDHTVTHAIGFTGTAFAGVRFNNSGQLERRVGAAYSNLATDEWQDPVGGETSSDFEVLATTVSSSGAPSTNGTMGSWLNLGTTREWYASKFYSTTGTAQWVIDFDIRPTGGSIIASGRMTLNVNRSI
jgi:hypothetical protein